MIENPPKLFSSNLTPFINNNSLMSYYIEDIDLTDIIDSPDNIKIVLNHTLKYRYVMIKSKFYNILLNTAINIFQIF